MIRTATLLALLALASCAPTPQIDYAHGPTAPLNEVANLDGLTVRPVAVLEDSRCPASVQCVWAGRLVVRTMTNAGAGEDVLDLTLGEPHKMNVGYLTLVDVRPSKRTPEPIPPREYQFTFTFQRL